MPELPEVETVVRGLKKKLTGRTIKQVEVLRRSIVKNITAAQLSHQLEGLPFEIIRRRGKFIIFQLGGGHLVSHLRMTGKYLFFSGDEYKELAYQRMLIHITDGSHLVYQDIRCLGTINYYSAKVPIPPIDRLGPEPLSSKFTPSLLAEILKRTKREIKPVLMDQQRLAGIGNIYASEILFQSRIHPEAQANNLRSTEITLLYNAIGNVLKRAIKLHGTSFSDYRDVENQHGRFQDFLCVYQREDRPCRGCGELVRKITQGGRSTFFCPQCQQ
jgi:formamidopyrimidine-DNA glycosylase